MARTSPAAALLVAILGVGVFATMDAVMKRLTLANGVYPVLLWRNLMGAALCGAPFLARRRGWPDRAAMRIHLERGAITAAMALLFFWGLARTPLARAVALTFIAPIAALFLARLLLGERLRPLAIAGSVLALCGVATILVEQPHAARPDALAGALAVLGSAICYAYNIILMRRQSLISGPLEIAFFQNLVIALLLAAGAPFLSTRLIDGGQWLPIALAAILATVSLLLLGWAYAHAEASYLATSEFSAFIWSASLGWLVFGERLTRATLAGAVLIVAGCLIATRRKGEIIP